MGIPSFVSLGYWINTSCGYEPKLDENLRSVFLGTFMEPNSTKRLLLDIYSLIKSWFHSLVVSSLWTAVP